MTLIVDHFQSPRNYGLISNADVDCEDVNAGCGDRVRLQARLRSTDEIIEIGFVGEGCVISIAAASILTTMVDGLTIGDVVQLSESSVISALETSVSPRRFDCALLAYRTFRAGLVWYVHDQRLSAS